MSSIKKVNISRKKQDLQNSRQGYLGTKTIRFNHQASAGETSIDLTALVNGIPGFSNPNPNEFANIQAFKNNLRIHSSLGYDLVQDLDYIVNGTTITFIGDMLASGSQEGEIFIGELNITASNAVVSESRTEVFEGVLPVNTTSINIGTTYAVNAKSSQQIGDIKVYRNGKLQLRCIGNNIANDGNYIEIDSGNGFGNQIQFKTANVSLDDSVIVDFGVHQVADINVFSDLERLAGSVNQIADDLALVTGNNKTDYFTASASEVDRLTLSNDVIQNKADVEDLKDPTQMSNALATILGKKTYDITAQASITSGSVISCRATPYRMQDGAWRMKFELTITGPAGPVSFINPEIAGITTNGVYKQSLAVGRSNAGGSLNGYILENSNVLVITSGTSINWSVFEQYISGDIALASKPTWAI